jgi:hypothetical protein
MYNALHVQCLESIWSFWFWIAVPGKNTRPNIYQFADDLKTWILVYGQHLTLNFLLAVSGKHLTSPKGKGGGHHQQPQQPPLTLKSFHEEPSSPTKLKINSNNNNNNNKSKLINAQSTESLESLSDELTSSTTTSRAHDILPRRVSTRFLVSANLIRKDLRTGNDPHP